MPQKPHRFYKVEWFKRINLSGFGNLKGFKGYVMPVSFFFRNLFCRLNFLTLTGYGRNMKLAGRGDLEGIVVEKCNHSGLGKLKCD